MSKQALPPGPRGILPGGSMLLFRRTPWIFLNLARTYGDVVYFQVGPRRFFLVNDPALIREVLVTRTGRFVKGWGPQPGHSLLGDGLLSMEGERHRQQRRLAQPAFRADGIRTCAEKVARHGARWCESLPEGRPVDICKELMRLSLNISNDALFGVDLSRDADRILAATTAVLGFGSWMFPFAGPLKRMGWPFRLRRRRALRYLKDVLRKIIADRKTSETQGDDLLALLLDACGGQDGGGEMTETEVRDQVATFFVAGHAASGNALAWTVHLLTQHADVAARLHDEATRVLDGRPPDAADYPRLAYAQMVFSEALRLYPPSWMMGRRATESFGLGDYIVPRGGVVLLSPFVTHRDERYYPDPEKFDPERWRPEARASRPPFAFFPFGGGPRGCLGERFAWMEGTLVLSMLAQRWQMRPAPGAVVRVKPLFLLRPENGVSVILSRW